MNWAPILAGSLKINQAAATPAQRLATDTGLASRIAIWDRDSVLVTLNLFPVVQVIQFNQLGPRVPGVLHRHRQSHIGLAAQRGPYGVFEHGRVLQVHAREPLPTRTPCRGTWTTPGNGGTRRIGKNT